MDPVAGELSLFLDGASMLAEDLSSLGASDAWIWPTIFAPQLHACSMVRPAAKIAGCIHFEPTFQAANGRMWWRYGFIRAQRADLSTNIGVTGPRLQSEFVPLTVTGKIDCFPVPHDGALTGSAKTALRRIGFFGHQRLDKGASLLPALVPRLLQHGYQIVLHDSGGLVRAEDAPGLTVLGYVPSLAEEIAKCDLIVAPYDPTAYRQRNSGVVWDAVASGVPVIVPSGTAPGRLVEQTGAGRTVMSLSVDEIYRAVLRVEQDYHQISGAALAASKHWRDTQGVKRFVATLLRDPPSVL